jgi:hypothetical protein
LKKEHLSATDEVERRLIDCREKSKKEEVSSATDEVEERRGFIGCTRS